MPDQEKPVFVILGSLAPSYLAFERDTIEAAVDELRGLVVLIKTGLADEPTACQKIAYAILQRTLEERAKQSIGGAP